MKVEDLNPSEMIWLGQMQEGGRVLHNIYVGPLDTLPDSLPSTQSGSSGNRTKVLSGATRPWS